MPPQEAAIFDLEFSPDGKLLASGDTFGNVLLMKSGDQEIVHAMTEAHEVSIRNVCFLNHGSLLASLDLQGRILIWSTNSGKRLQELDLDHFAIAIAADAANSRLIALTDAPALQSWTELDGDASPQHRLFF